MTAVETAAGPGVLSNARGLWLVLEAADLRGLPMPFAFRAYDRGAVTLQFHSRDEVVTWAEALEVDVEDDVDEHRDGVNDVATALGEWLEVPVEVCCSVQRRPS